VSVRKHLCSSQVIFYAPIRVEVLRCFVCIAVSRSLHLRRKHDNSQPNTSYDGQPIPFVRRSEKDRFCDAWCCLIVTISTLRHELNTLNLAGASYASSRNLGQQLRFCGLGRIRPDSSSDRTGFQHSRLVHSLRRGTFRQAGSLLASRYSM
jgi:hypothetical protein